VGQQDRPDTEPRGAEWHWQLQHALEEPAALAALQPAGAPDLAVWQQVAETFPLRVTPYYAGLIDPGDPADPLARMVLPDPHELDPSRAALQDPLAEDEHSPVPRLVHRYRDRALLLLTLSCASYCRHCTRKRAVGRGARISEAELAGAIDYLRAHPEVWDLLLSGGDPLTLSDAALDRILTALRTVPSLRVLRLGTRVPAVLPQRVTPALVEILARHGPLFVATHCNHPRELSPEAVAACGRMADAGLPLANQTVLLRGVNDSPATIEDLCRRLLAARVRPYYLLQCDLAPGVEHLRTPLARGVEILEALRGRLSGLAIPTFVVDGPEGSGKMPLTPNYLVSWAPGRAVLRNFEGQFVVYPDPEPLPEPCASSPPSSRSELATRPTAPPRSRADLGAGVDGVAGLLAGEGRVLRPASSERQERRGDAPRSLAQVPAAPRGVLLLGPAHAAGSEREPPAAVARLAALLGLSGHTLRLAALGPRLAALLGQAPPRLVLPWGLSCEPGADAAQAAALCQLFEVPWLGPSASLLARVGGRHRWRAPLLAAGVPVAAASEPPVDGALRVPCWRGGLLAEPLLASRDQGVEAPAEALSLARAALRVLDCDALCLLDLRPPEGSAGWRIADLDLLPELGPADAPLPRWLAARGLGGASGLAALLDLAL